MATAAQRFVKIMTSSEPDLYSPFSIDWTECPTSDRSGNEDAGVHVMVDEDDGEAGVVVSPASLPICLHCTLTEPDRTGLIVVLLPGMVILHGPPPRSESWIMKVPTVGPQNTWVFGPVLLTASQRSVMMKAFAQRNSSVRCPPERTLNHWLDGMSPDGVHGSPTDGFVALPLGMLGIIECCRTALCFDTEWPPSSRFYRPASVDLKPYQTSEHDEDRFECLYPRS